MRSFKSFSLRLRLRRFFDDINREIDAMGVLLIFQINMIILIFVKINTLNFILAL